MPDPRQPLLVTSSDIFTWEGTAVLTLQIRGTQRARVVKLLKVLASIEADDAKPAARRARAPKVKIFDPTVSFSAVTNLPDMVADIRARCQALLARV